MSPYSHLDPQSFLQITQCSRAYFYRYFEKALQCFIQIKPSPLQKSSSEGNVILPLCLSRSMANLTYSVFVGLSHWFTAEFVNVSSYLLKVDYHGQ